VTRCVHLPPAVKPYGVLDLHGDVAVCLDCWVLGRGWKAWVNGLVQTNGITEATR
jgi:hypothetical protein